MSGPAGAPKLLVMGNIASGKTTLAEEVGRVLGWPIVGIDGARRALGDGSPAGEAAAWALFLERAAGRTPVLLECTGGGPFVHLLRLALEQGGGPWAILHVRTPASECLRRALLRLPGVPYPAFAFPLEQVIPAVEKEVGRLLGTHWPCPLVEVPGDGDSVASLSEVEHAVSAWMGGAT